MSTERNDGREVTRASAPTNPMAMSCPHLAETFNLMDPDQAANPYLLFAQGRRECPVFYSPAAGAWIVTRYDDIAAIAHDWMRFSSAHANKTTQELPPEALAIKKLEHAEVPGLVDCDPPQHTRFRKLTNQAFTVPRVRAMEPAIRRTAIELLDQFPRDGRADLVKQFAMPLPLLTIMRVLGLPDHDAPLIRTWSVDYNRERSPSLPLEERLQYTHGVAALRFSLASAVEERRARPREDALTHLVQAEADGEKLSTWEIVSIAHQLVFAGHETTIGLIGTMLHHLLMKPERWQAVRENPDLIPRAVEEALRREGPVTGMFRTTTQPVEIGGVSIPKGARIQLMFASGSHDEKYFEDAERFDLSRENLSEHMAFGVERHFCIGAPLARAVGRIALETLVERLPGLRLVPDQKVEFTRSALFHARASLAVEWDVS